MTVETGLVIVGGADDQLRLTNKKKRAELVTPGITLVKGGKHPFDDAA